MAWVDWLIQTTLGHIVGLFVTAGVAGMAAYLKGKGSSWAASLLYGLLGALLVIGIVAGLACISSLSYFSERQKPHVTSDNVETKIREWVYTFGGSATKCSGS